MFLAIAPLKTVSGYTTYFNVFVLQDVDCGLESGRRVAFEKRRSQRYLGGTEPRVDRQHVSQSVSPASAYYDY